MINRWANLVKILNQHDKNSAKASKRKKEKHKQDEKMNTKGGGIWAVREEMFLLFNSDDFWDSFLSDVSKETWLLDC